MVDTGYPRELREYLDERDLPRFDGRNLKGTFATSDNRFQSGGIDDRPVEASFTYCLAECAIEQLRTYGTDANAVLSERTSLRATQPYYLPEKYLTMDDPAEMSLPESAIRGTFEKKPESHKAQRLDFLATEDWLRIIAAYYGWVTFIDG